MSEAARREITARFNVSRETLARIDIILAVLDDWRQRFNLVGPREWPVIWERHVADSLQLAEFIPVPSRIVDLGSGAGFPGLVLAAAQAEGGEVVLVESVGKKCAFLSEAIAAARLPARVMRARIESLQGWPVDFVTARALAPLPRLLELSAPWLEKGGKGLFPKGARWNEELTAAQQKWKFSCQARPSRTHEGGAVLEISKVNRNDG